MAVPALAPIAPPSPFPDATSGDDPAFPLAPDALLTPGFDAGIDTPPIDLAEPDPFRPDEPEITPMTFDIAAADDLSAWEDDAVPLAPLSIG